MINHDFGAIASFATTLLLLPLLGCGTTAPRYDVLLAGDTGFGENYGDTRRMLEREGYDHAFAAMKPLMRSADEIIVNLETPITDVERSPYEGKKRWLHKGDVVRGPRALEEHGIRAVSLANNHTLDYGVDGLEQTLEIAAAHGLMTFGAGADQEAARRPLEREIEVGSRKVPMAVFASFEYKANLDVNFGFYAGPTRAGVSRLCAETLEDIRRYRNGHPHALVVAFPHWGANYRWKTELQTRWARRMIDAGADLVVGHGSHMLQEIERYKGRWILYSLGNFVFNSPGRYATFKAPPYSLAAALRLNLDGEVLRGRLVLYPIFSDNRITDYRPRPLTDDEFDHAVELLAQHSGGTWTLERHLRRGRDRIGPYLELDL